MTSFVAAGGEAVLKQPGVSGPSEVSALVQFSVEAFGRLDIAFNNTGYQESRALLADQADDVFETVFTTTSRPSISA